MHYLALCDQGPSAIFSSYLGRGQRWTISEILYDYKKSFGQMCMQQLSFILQYLYAQFSNLKMFDMAQSLWGENGKFCSSEQRTQRFGPRDGVRYTEVSVNLKLSVHFSLQVARMLKVCHGQIELTTTRPPQVNPSRESPVQSKPLELNLHNVLPLRDSSIHSSMENLGKM